MQASTHPTLFSRLRRRAVVAIAAVGVVICMGVLASLQAIEAFDPQRSDRVSTAMDDLSDWLAVNREIGAHGVHLRSYLSSADGATLWAHHEARRAIAEPLARLRARRAGANPLLDDVERHVARLDLIAERTLSGPPQPPGIALEAWERESRSTTAATLAAIERATTTARSQFVQTRDQSTASRSHAVHKLIALGAAVLLGILALSLLFARTAIDLVHHCETDQEQTMFHLLDQLPIGVLVITPDGKPWFANQCAHEMLGPSVGHDNIAIEAMSSTYAVYQAGTDTIYPTERAPLTRALAGEIADVSDMELHRGDEIVPLHVYGSPIRNRRGEIAFAVATFQNVHTLHRVAHEDALTGLPNRLAATHVYNRERLRCARNDRPLAIAILDLDRFKLINDTHGHAMGDEVLRRTGQAVTRALRKTDLVARWGGEELVVMLPETDVAGAEQTIARTLDSLMDESFLGRDGRRFRITFSAGVVIAAPSELLDAAVARADVLLYAAKRAGRARVFAARDANPVGAAAATVAAPPSTSASSVTAPTNGAMAAVSNGSSVVTMSNAVTAATNAPEPSPRAANAA